MKHFPADAHVLAECRPVYVDLPGWEKDLSAMRHLDALARVPLFLLHGDADAVVAVHHSRDLAAAVRAAGGAVAYREVPGGGHDDFAAAGAQDEIVRFITSAEATRGDA